jgi:hypothetical protein
MEKIAFTRACLSDVRVLMVIYTCTLGRVATSNDDEMDSCTRVPAARHTWSLWPCPVVSGGKSHCFPSLWHLVKSRRYWKLLDGAIGCLGPSWVEEAGGSGRQVVKFCLPTSIVMRKRDGANCSRVQFSLGWWLLLFSHEW